MPNPPNPQHAISSDSATGHTKNDRPDAGFEPGDAALGRPRLPAGRAVDLPERGITFVRELPGPPGAPVVFLLHGWTVSAAVNWFPVYEPLSELARVVSLDHRGHGQGIRHRDRFRLSDAADDVVALADELGVEQFVVAGYSMGGIIAQLVARRHPHRVRGMVLSATWCRHPRRHRQTRLLRAAGRAGRGTRVLSPQRQQALFRWGYMKASGREEQTGSQWFSDEVRAGSVPMILEAGGELARFDSRSWLGQVDVPTGIAITTRDSLVGADLQHRLAALVPRAELRSIPIDHDGCVTEPAVFVPPFLELVSHAAGLG